jgi:hypothetical protein
MGVEVGCAVARGQPTAVHGRIDGYASGIARGRATCIGACQGKCIRAGCTERYTLRAASHGFAP